MATLKQLPALVVLERIPVPVLAIANDGALVFANSAFSEMVGRAPEDVVSLKFDEIFHLPLTHGVRGHSRAIPGQRGSRVGPPGRFECARADEQVGADPRR